LKLLLSLASGLWAKLAVGAAAIGAFLLWVAGQRRDAVREERARQTEETINEVRKYREEADDNDGLDSDALRQRLRERGAVRPD
jgi:hypothetical protein